MVTFFWFEVLRYWEMLGLLEIERVNIRNDREVGKELKIWI